MTQPRDREEPSKKCACPYCEEELVVSESPFCQGCGVTLVRCDACGHVLITTVTVCPNCGAAIKE